MDKSLLDRLKMAVRGAGGAPRVAKQAGISLGTLQKNLAGTSKPSFETIAALANICGFSLDWLLTGKGEAFVDVTRTAAVIGLASCGPTGWARMEGLRFRARVPLALQSDLAAFSVLITGQSMQPFGLYEGFLCWCSPAMEPKIGDMVCIERRGEDGEINLTVKMLGMIGHGAYEIIGFQPPEEIISSGKHGREVQEQFWEVVPKSEVERISVIAHIITRPEIG